jgi:hypothetical protein
MYGRYLHRSGYLREIWVIRVTTIDYSGYSSHKEYLFGFTSYMDYGVNKVVRVIGLDCNFDKVVRIIGFDCNFDKVVRIIGFDCNFDSILLRVRGSRVEGRTL